MRTRATLRALWVLALLQACSGEPPPVRNALLITLDTTRRDALGCYAGRASTPHLDRLAREGIVFEEARSVAPLTLPAHASMLTGLYPLRHGLRDNGWTPLSSEVETLPERAHAAGFETAAFIAAIVLDASFGLARGFEVYDQPERATEQFDLHFAERGAPEVIAAARAWLARRDRTRPFLAWVHLFDPHAPYAPPATFAAGGDPYLGEVAAMDASIGVLLEALRADGTLEETLVLVVADHGESLGEHGEATHGVLCSDVVLRVPLIARLPGRARAGERSRVLASVVDVAPTIAGALGLGTPPDRDGIDLLASSGAEREGVYFESYEGWLNYGWSPLAGWAERDVKYLHSSEPELYRTAEDPREARDLFAEDAPEVARARAALTRLAARPSWRSADTGGVDPALLAAVASLGYSALGPGEDELPGPLDAGERPAPRRRIDELRRVQAATTLASARRFDEAVAALEELRRENPGNLRALDVLAVALIARGDHARARSVLEDRIARGPAPAQTWVNYADTLVLTGSLEEADVALRRARELDPQHPEVDAKLEQLRGMLGR